MTQNSFEKNGGTYTLANDCLIPNLILPEEKPLGKWGLLRKHYLRENHRALYSSWLLTGKLDEHLTQIEKDSEVRFEDFMDAQREVTVLTDCETFCFAFKLGAKIMMDVLTDGPMKEI